jgi:hypothetical protein
VFSVTNLIDPFSLIHILCSTVKASIFQISGVFAIVVAAATAIPAESASPTPHFSIEMTPYQGEPSFYNPQGEIFSSIADKGVIWDGESARPAELTKANENGDGFVNARIGYVLTLGNEHAIYRGNVRVKGTNIVVDSFGGESSWVLNFNSLSHFIGCAEDPLRVRQPWLFKEGVIYRLNELIEGPVRFDTPQLIRDDGVIFGSRYIDGGSNAIVRLTPRIDGKYDAVDLAILPGSVAFNKKGGAAFKSGYWHDGEITSIGDLGMPDRVYPNALNSFDEIVGVAMTSNDNNYHGFYWDGRMHDLKDLVELPAGWLPSPIAEDLNEYGQIAGYVYTGTQHMLLRLTPPPKITSTLNSSEGFTIRFRPGSVKPVSIQTSSDLTNWTEIKSISAPAPEETVQAQPQSPGSVHFFRVVRK